MGALFLAVLLAFPIAAPKTGPAPYFRDQIRVATNEQISLAIWRDTRVSGAAPKIWGNRIDADGGALDPLGFPIGDAPLIDGRPFPIDVASNGDGFLAAWAGIDRRINLAGITRDGAVSPPIVLDIRPTELALASAGKDYALVYIDELRPSTIQVLVIDAQGRVMRAPQMAIESSVGPNEIAAASNPASLAIAWADRRDGDVHKQEFRITDVLGGRIEPPAEVAGRAFKDMPYGTAITWTSQGFAMAWTYVDAPFAEYRLRCSDSGPTIALGRTPTGGRPRISGTTAVYHDDPMPDLRISRFNCSGAIPIAAPSTRATDVDVAGNTFVWIDRDNIARSHLVATPRTDILSFGLVDRSHAQAVPLGEHYLATWWENRTHAMFGRFTARGEQLDRGGIRLGTGIGESAPSIAGDGTSALVAWQETLTTRIVFITPDGRFTEVHSEPATLPSRRPAVHWNGEQYAVAWLGRDARMYMMRFDRNGVPLDAAPVAVSTLLLDPISLAWTGRNYVVLGRVFSQICHPVCDVFLAGFTVSRDLVPLEASINLGYLRGLQTIHLSDGVDDAIVLWRDGDTVVGWVLAGDGLPAIPFALPGATYVSDVTLAGRNGWTVLAGPDAWHVSRDGVPGPRTTAYPFIPAGAESMLVDRAPIPLVVYRTPSGALEAEFIVPARRRTVRP